MFLRKLGGQHITILLYIGAYDLGPGRGSVLMPCGTWFPSLHLEPLTPGQEKATRCKYSFANDDGAAGTSTLFTWKVFFMAWILSLKLLSIRTVYEENAWVRMAF